MNTKTVNTLLVGLAATVAVIFGIWLGYSTRDHQALSSANTSPTPAIQGAILPSPRPLDSVQLQSTDRPQFTEKDFQGYWNLIFVGYTHCPDVCPTTLSVLNQVNQLMEEQGLAPPRMVFISIDPERDTLEVIDQYVKYFNESFIGLTSDQAHLASLSRQLSVVYAKAPGADGSMSEDNYLMDHSSSLILLNPDAAVQAILTAPHTPMQIIDSIVRTQVYYYE